MQPRMLSMKSPFPTLAGVLTVAILLTLVPMRLKRKMKLKQSPEMMSRSGESDSIASPLRSMRGKNVPAISILHGEDDVRVPLSQGWGFQRACRDYDVPCEMAVYPREGHMITERMQMIDMALRSLRFCDRNLAFNR